MSGRVLEIGPRPPCSVADPVLCMQAINNDVRVWGGNGAFRWRSEVSVQASWRFQGRSSTSEYRYNLMIQSSAFALGYASAYPLFYHSGCPLIPGCTGLRLPLFIRRLRDGDYSPDVALCAGRSLGRCRVPCSPLPAFEEPLMTLGCRRRMPSQHRAGVRRPDRR